MDSNIDLLKLNIPNHANFLNLIIEKGFLPSICKATRCQNESKTLIDQILFNKNCENFYSGTIISDTSDHFIPLQPPLVDVNILIQKMLPSSLVIILCKTLIFSKRSLLLKTGI